ncbi:MAG: CBS domain-containing protein [Roseiflexaceae bacterium]
MMTVRHLLQDKPDVVWSVTPETLVFDAIKLMADKEIGALVVCENRRLVGIITERDYATKLALHDKSSRSTPVREVMTTRVYYVQPDHTVEDCMAIMNEKHLRHLPVIDQDQVVGVVSIRDVIKVLLDDRQFMIEQLENYIRG